MGWRWQLPAYSPVPFEALRSGTAALLGLGSEAPERFRERILRELGVSEALLTDSGTSALAVALSLGAKGSKLPVALPAYGCYDMATAVRAAEVRVRLYDLDPATLGPDMGSLRRTVDEGVWAIVVAHLYGIPVAMNEVLELADEAGVMVIEDAAQGFGASYAGRRLGTLGPVGVLSFGRGKGITGGGGGALLWNARSGGSSRPGAVTSGAEGEREPELGRGPVGLREVLALAVLWALGRPGLYRVAASLPFLHLGETVYREPRRPRDMAGPSAAALLGSWASSMSEAETRRRNAAILERHLRSGVRAVKPVVPPAGAEPGYLRFPLIVPRECRNFLLSGTGRSLGIMPGYPRVLAHLPGFGEQIEGRASSWSGAETLAHGLCTLPTHSWLTEQDRRRTVEHVEAAALGRRPSSGSEG